MSKRDLLNEVWEQVHANTTPLDFQEIVVLTTSPDKEKRLFALLSMQELMDAGNSPSVYFEMAHTMMRDPDNTCRWQALIVIGHFLEDNPDAVWQVVREFGGSGDEDMRAGVACVLLEALLEAHFEDYFPKVRKWILLGPVTVAETLDMCWFDGCQGNRYKRVQNLLRNVARGRPDASPSRLRRN